MRGAALAKRCQWAPQKSPGELLLWLRMDPRGLTGDYLTASGPASDPPERGVALEMCATKRVPNLTGGSLEDIHHPFRAE